MGVRSRALSAGTRAAAAAFACYVAMAWLVGERFPFSRFSMYASLGTYRQSHVPVFLADGHPAEARSFHRFAGIDPEVIAPGTRICSLNHRIDEDARWIAAHRAGVGEAPGPVMVAYGFVPIRLEEDRIERGRVEIVARGTAWPR